MNLIHVFTKNWLLRLFYLLAIVSGIVSSFALEDKMTVSVVFFMAGNFYLYLTLAYRILILSQNDFAYTIPNYFEKLKKTLLIIVLVSLLPNLVILPDVQLFSAALTWQLSLLILLVLTAFQPKTWFLLAFIFIAPSVLEEITDNSTVSLDVFSYYNYSFPLLFAVVFLFLHKLEKIKLSDKAKSQYLKLANQSMMMSFSDNEKKALKSPNKVQQWFNGGNLAIYRKMLMNNQVLKRHQLVEISCVGPSSIGRASWLAYTCGIVLFCLTANYFSFSFEAIERSYLMFVGVITSGFVGISSTTFLYTAKGRKNYLARLRVSPLFHDDQQFSYALLTTLFKSQITVVLLAVVNSLIVFITVIPELGNVLSNTLAINALLFFLGTGLVLLSFQTTWLHEYFVYFIIGIATLVSVFLVDISLSNQFELINNPIYVYTLLMSVGLFVMGLVAWLTKPISWQRVT